MIDPCDNCNKPLCYGCIYADCEAAEEQLIYIKQKERKDYLTNQIHQASQIIWWLSYQPEMSDSEHKELERMTAFLENLRDRI